MRFYGFGGEVIPVVLVGKRNRFFSDINSARVVPGATKRKSEIPQPAANFQT